MNIICKIKLIVMIFILLCVTAYGSWDVNPSFETSWDNGWFQFGPSIGNNTEVVEPRSGILSMAFDTPTVSVSHPNDVPRYTMVDHPHNLTIPGQDYIATVYYFVNEPLQNFERFGVGIFWIKVVSGSFVYSDIDIGGWEVVYGPDSIQGLPTGEEAVGEWTQIAFKAIAPSDAEFMQIATEVKGVGSSVYFDDVFVFPDLSSSDSPARFISIINNENKLNFMWSNPLGHRAYSVETYDGLEWNLLEELNFLNYDPILYYEDAFLVLPNINYRLILRN